MVRSRAILASAIINTPAAEMNCFIQVMGDEHHRHAALLPDRSNQLLHAAARVGVQRAEGLVHQQDARMHDQRLRNSHALLHAAR